MSDDNPCHEQENWRKAICAYLAKVEAERDAFKTALELVRKELEDETGCICEYLDHYDRVCPCCDTLGARIEKVLSTIRT